MHLRLRLGWVIALTNSAFLSFVTAETATAPSETLDTATVEMSAAVEPIATVMSAAADSSQNKTMAMDSAKTLAAAQKDPIALETQKLARFKVGGMVRGTAYARDFNSDSDIDKTVSFGLDLARFSFAGDFGNGYGFAVDLDAAKGVTGVGTGQISLQWQKGLFDRVRAGKIKRAFSHEALTSDAALPFNFRGRLYQDFLRKKTGYTGYDLGIDFASGFEDTGIPVRYELGIYNGRQSNDALTGYDADNWKDTDLKAKDLCFRVEAEPTKNLTVEGAVTTKAAEDKSDPNNFTMGINSAYELGAFYKASGLHVNAEVAYGDNHQSTDALIIKGSSQFLAFYLETTLRHDYGKTGHWSETLLKFEGLDPDMGFGKHDGKPNDGNFRYTVAATYGLTTDISVSAAWGILQPITENRETSASRLRHDLDLYWKMVF